MKTNTVACSSNAEFFGTFHDNPDVEKLLLSSYDLLPAGTSVCVAKAMQIVGSRVQTFGLVGPSGSLANDMLELAARRAGISLHRLDALDRTSFAFLPLDLSQGRSKVAGEKGKVLPHKVGPACKVLEEHIKASHTGFGVMTGLREEELPFAEVVFRNTQKGMRVLSPRREFCDKLAGSGVLSNVDCLVVNEIEFQATGLSLRDLHNIGPRVVIVTRGKEGGEALINDHAPVKYDPVVETDHESPGTGDWFLGAFLAFMDHRSLAFNEVTQEELGEALQFAARIAGRKATISGSTNGPSEEFCRSSLFHSQRV